MMTVLQVLCFDVIRFKLFALCVIKLLDFQSSYRRVAWAIYDRHFVLPMFHLL